MKKFMKFISLVLVVMTLLAVSAPALAATSTLAPGQKKYKSYEGLSSAPSYTVSLTTYTQYNQFCKVTLSLNDLEDGGAWKVSAVKTLKRGSTDTVKISPTDTFKWVSGRSDKARLTFEGLASNSFDVYVSYPD